MRTLKMILASTVVALAASAAPLVHAHGTDDVHDNITPAFRTAIANVPGKTMTAIVVDYKPGQKSPPHRHGQAFVVGYVLSGAISSQLNDGESRVYHAGESWTEVPGVHHTVSENASTTRPAKLLAIFVADDNDKDLVTWDKH
jgi:quercetin dioxygenase-like cupin family protein